MNDIAVRAIKTFFQAFFGILIPELVVFLQEDFPVDMSFPAIVFAPMFCSALAAGISALWNYVSYLLSGDNNEIIYIRAAGNEEDTE